MSKTPIELKKEVRRTVRDRLRQVTIGELETSGQRLFEVLSEGPLFENRRRLFGFYPCRNEIDCLPFLEHWLNSGREVFLPRVSDDRKGLEVWRVPHLEAVEKGHYGIMEPARELCELMDPQTIDVVLVPGLAFESNGARLGQGAAYYDKLLKMIPRSIPRVAVAHSWQLLDRPNSLAPGVSIPMEEHDEWMDWIATTDELLKCRVNPAEAFRD